ncbi:Gag-Pol polyprotein, partial [Stegodyphus mimosarum]
MEGAVNSVKEEMKAGQKSVKEEMKAGQESVKEELKAGQASVKDGMKAIQESVKDEMKAVQEEMKLGQESVKEEIRAVKASQEEMKKEITCIIENKFEAMEGRIDAVENKVSSVKEQIEERVSAVEQQIDYRVSAVKEQIQERVSAVEHRIEGRVSAVQHQIEKQIDDKVSAVAKEVDTLKKFVATAGSNSDTFKFLAMPAHPSVKLSTYDGKTSWQVYKTQFSIVAEANGWDSQAKACHLAASLRADAADILQTLPENQRLDFEALPSALELRFGEKCLKDYSRLQLKSRQQKPTEKLQELATDVERLSHLAFSECPTEIREILSLQYFIDGIRDPEIQKALRMADVKDLKSALVYAMKFEVAQQATLKDRYPVRAVRVHEPVDQLMARLDYLTRQLNALQRNIGNKKPTVKCWNCGAVGHMRRNCRTSHSTENKMNDVNTQLNAMRWKRSDKKPKCWNCGAEGHVRRNCRTPQSTENKIIFQQRRRKQTNDHIEERRLSDSEKSCFKALKISAMGRSSNGLSINGHIDGFPCSMIIGTGAYVTIIRRDLVQKFKDKLIWTPSCVTLEIASGEKLDIEGKLNVSITFGSATYHHTPYVADIIDPCILGLDFLRKYNFSLDFKNNKLFSAFDDMTIDPQKGSSPRNADVSSERPCSESCRNHTEIEEKPETTSNSPAQMLIGRDLRLPCDFLIDRLADTSLIGSVSPLLAKA